MDTLDTLTGDASESGLYDTSSEDYAVALKAARSKKSRTKAK
jgi:hypothetical protein